MQELCYYLGIIVLYFFGALFLAIQQCGTGHEVGAVGFDVPFHSVVRNTFGSCPGADRTPNVLQSVKCVPDFCRNSFLGANEVIPSPLQVLNSFCSVFRHLGFLPWLRTFSMQPTRVVFGGLLEENFARRRRNSNKKSHLLLKLDTE